MGNTKSTNPQAIEGGPETSSSSKLVKIVKGSDHDMPLWALSVLEYLSWETRYEVSFLSKSWHRNTTTLAYYRFLCQRLSLECGVYAPTTPPAGETWRTLYFDLYRLRNLWRAKPLEVVGTQKENSKRFKISVYAKFRPSSFDMKDKTSKQDGSEDSKTPREQGVTLPLHQKLAMIRMSHNIKSNRRALRLLTEEGSWFSAKWSALSDEVGAEPEMSVATGKEETEVENDENSPHNAAGKSSSANFTTKEGKAQNRRLLAFTAARRRAASGLGASSATDSARGQKQNQQMVSKVHSLDSLSGRVVMLTPDVGLREFSFDGVLSGTSSQAYAYDLCTKRLIMDLFNGFNATAIVYGQTGSGKTYSMFGRDETSMLSRESSRENNGKGMIPRACEELLTAVDYRQRMNSIESEICVSYVEVFGDQVSDLLRQGARCGHSKVAAQRYVLNGASEHRVHTMEDIHEVLRIGEQQKRRAATAMNERSSRAHSLFIVTLKQRKMPQFMSSSDSAASITGMDVTLQTRLFLADLGGSEQVKKSQVEAGQHRLINNNGTNTSATAAASTAGATFSVGFEKAEHMREAVNINLGLLALKKCIEALNQNLPYVPYQDSKLTMLLSEGLGGNCKTSIIVCANMDSSHASETVATLRFGERCANIENKARNNATILASILADLDQRIADLEQLILRKEKWEIREIVREDNLAEDGTLEKALGGQEVLKQTFVTGAELERGQLAQLLVQRQQFSGVSSSLSSSGAEGLEGEDDDADIDAEALSSATAAAAAAVAVDGAIKKKTKKKVLGFGRAVTEIYGFGDTYDATHEYAQDNERFVAQTQREQLPSVVRRAKRGIAWAQGDMVAAEPEDHTSESFQLQVRKANKIRAKLAYSGISA